jgi:hypothetical protein
MNIYLASIGKKGGSQKKERQINKTGNVRINVKLWRVCVTSVAVERQ